MSYSTSRDLYSAYTLITGQKVSCNKKKKKDLTTKAIHHCIITILENKVL